MHLSRVGTVPTSFGPVDPSHQWLDTSWVGWMHAQTDVLFNVLLPVHPTDPTAGADQDLTKDCFMDSQGLPVLWLGCIIPQMCCCLMALPITLLILLLTIAKILPLLASGAAAG
eukprot:9489006-Pyramimonas_sp.AAC.1